jgi:ParB/RepB/Spo0J family partition protein
MDTAAAIEAAVAPPAAMLVELPIRELFSSETNPRRHFSPIAIDELAASIAEKGILLPIVVRAHAGKKGAPFEIIAGERRWRAATRAGLARVPCVVREYSDEQVLEIQLIENMQRSDLTPLEQARGCRRLIDSNPDKHSAASIARKLGLSTDVVWDLLKLNDLVPEAAALLEDGRIQKSHAVIIARQKPEDQARILDPGPANDQARGREGLWQIEYGVSLFGAGKGGKAGKYDGLKPVSARELQEWVDRHIRFDVAHAAAAQPLEFEETAAVVLERGQDETAAQTAGRKVIAITYEYRVADDARSSEERTYGSNSWLRADGKGKSKTCDFSVLGVVAAGEGRGSTLEVCINREHCLVHFGKVIRERKQREKVKASGKAPANKTAAEARHQAQEARAAAKRARWQTIGEGIEKAVGAKVKGLKAPAPALLAWALKELRLPNTPAKGLAAMLAAAAIEELNFAWQGNEQTVRHLARLVGVDVKAIERALDAKATS